MMDTSASVSNLPRVPSRGRPPEYTPEEDAIILKHRNTEDVLRLLKEAGFPERTPAAIWSRRRYLNEVGASELTTELVNSHELLPVLSARREKLKERLRTVEQERDRLYEEIADISAEMHRLIDGE